MTYFVFRRTNAGGSLVGSIYATSRSRAEQRFATYVGYRFEVLLETDDWPEAEQLIRQERAIQPLHVDVFEPPARGVPLGEYIGQVVAHWEPDATCGECVDAWRVSVSSAGQREPLDTRPIAGAFMIQLDDWLTPMCRRHIETDGRLAICP